jgi:TusA-related sulfurtransferase
MKKKIPDEIIDLRGVPCPQNSARALLKLEAMDKDEILEIIIDEGVPKENVPSAISDNGFQILKIDFENDGKWHLFVKVS